MEQKIYCGGFEFFSNFDSANLAKVELVSPSETVITTAASAVRGVLPEIPDIEFNIWTKPDCCGTEFENSNRTWFYFGMRANGPGLLVRLNLVDLNKQSKMYSQGMAPVYRVLPGKPHWERIRDKPTYSNDNIFTLSFKYKTPENIHSVTYFAFTYPYSYTDLQNNLTVTDSRFCLQHPINKDDIYYVRECLCYSLEGRRIDLITISSYHNISIEREARLKNLFPEYHKPRPFKFIGKKVIFVSARVHPGETPSSFVFNGFLNLLTNRDDQVALALRQMYVFKLIPCLNPDGVSRGHYRTDTRGVNLNRMYLKPKIELHPSIYSARALLRYYHFGTEVDDDYTSSDSGDLDLSGPSDDSTASDVKLNNNISHMSIEERNRKEMNVKPQGDSNVNESGLFLYMDMHGHASKKGIFMYGNHFSDVERNVECMLLPKLMSINNHNFHFNACNFTEKNMYLKDKRDGMSREGSGRVAVLKMTGLVRSYTLECNYNTGTYVNVLPPTIKETNFKTAHTLPLPPKYNPLTFEEVGRALGSSILDLSGHNPLTRLPSSEFHSLTGLREWLRIHSANEFGDKRPSGKLKLKAASSLNNQGKARNTLKPRPLSTKTSPKKPIKNVRSTSVPVDRKENVVSTGLDEPCCSQNSLAGSAGSVCAPKNKQSKQNKTFSIRTRIDAKIQTKTRKDVSTKAMQTPSTVLSRHKLKPDQKLKMKCDDDNRVQLREICFIKDSEGKKVIAKYNKSDASPTVEDNLIVAWDAANTKAQVFSQKSVLPKFLTGEAGTSGGIKQGAFRVHNFAKTNSFVKGGKRIKRNLRRVATVNEERKIDKSSRKRKKLKSKV